MASVACTQEFVLAIAMSACLWGSSAKPGGFGKVERSRRDHKTLLSSGHRSSQTRVTKNGGSDRPPAIPNFAEQIKPGTKMPSDSLFLELFLCFAQCFPDLILYFYKALEETYNICRCPLFFLIKVQN